VVEGIAALIGNYLISNQTFNLSWYILLESTFYPELIGRAQESGLLKCEQLGRY